jgi:peptidyl-prolyl cis-trans isomerase SurA
MTTTYIRMNRSKVLSPLAGLSLVAAMLFAQPANAQVVVMVNGLPITAIDIEQRTKLEKMGPPKTLTRDQVLKMLIDDKLKITAAKRFGFEISDAEVDENFAEIARRSGQQADQFAQMLGRAGVTASALKGRIKADATWAQLVRGRFGQSLQVSDGELANALQSRSSEEVGYIYTLRPVVVVVPRGSPDAVIAAKRREAEGLRTQFQDCNQGLAFVRGLRDVAVRDPIRRTSADLQPALRELLSKLEIGKLTTPDVTPQGFQMFALCDKKESKNDTAEKRELKEKLYSERFEKEAKKFLEETRRTSIIEYR